MTNPLCRDYGCPHAKECLRSTLVTAPSQYEDGRPKEEIFFFSPRNIKRGTCEQFIAKETPTPHP